jgi:hypothetical protein
MSRIFFDLQFQAAKMKKILMMIALFGVPAVALTGCGGAESKVVENATESDGSMDTSQQEEYQKMMQSGGSAKPGN